MVAPKAETLFGRREKRVIGIALLCPEDDWPLRTETIRDYDDVGPIPDLAISPGPLGFIARCDRCGLRVEMHGDRLPTVAMIKEWRNLGFGRQP